MHRPPTPPTSVAGGAKNVRPSAPGDHAARPKHQRSRRRRPRAPGGATHWHPQKTPSSPSWPHPRQEKPAAWCPAAERRAEPIVGLADCQPGASVKARTEQLPLARTPSFQGRSGQLASTDMRASFMVAAFGLEMLTAPRARCGHSGRRVPYGPLPLLQPPANALDQVVQLIVAQILRTIDNPHLGAIHHPPVQLGKVHGRLAPVAH